MTRIILVRHGETDWNLTRRIQGGSSDTPLNVNGKQQAERIALRLRSEEIRSIYSSPLQRARHTAEAIASYHNLEVNVEPSLREIEVGEFEGVPVVQIGKYLDHILVGECQDGTLPKMPGGESLAEMQHRGWETIQRLAQKHPDEVVVVVCHYFIILAVICAVLDLPLSHIRRFRVSPGSISAIAFENGCFRLVLFNDVCHNEPS